MLRSARSFGASRIALAAVLLLALTLGACSDDDDGDDKKTSSSASTSTTTTTIKTLAAEEVNAGASAYCGAWAKIRAVGGATLTGDPKQDVEARKAHYETLKPLAADLSKTAPKEISEAVAFAVTQVEEVARTGSEEPFQGAEATKRQQELAKYAQDNCTKAT